jgi:predicted PurR-regulated permease PerM
MFFILSILLIILLIVYFFYWEIAYIVETLPSLTENISDKLHQVSISIGQYGVNIPDHITRDWIAKELKIHHDTVVAVLSSLGVTVADIFLICIYLFFLLYYQGIVHSFIEQKLKNKRKIENAKTIINKIQSLVNKYIIGLLLITLITFILNYIVLLLFQLKFALFFALFVSILSLIPYLGYPLGTLVIFLFAFLTKDNMLTAIFTAVFVYVNNIIQENILRPWLVGDQLKINAFIVFFFIIIGGIIWGIAGMVLFLPIVGIIKIFLESNPKTAPFAIFLADREYKIPNFEEEEKKE